MSDSTAPNDAPLAAPVNDPVRNIGASQSSPPPTGADATNGNLAAPRESLEREAQRRLGAGEDWNAIKTDLAGRRSGRSDTTNVTEPFTTQPAQPAPVTAAPNASEQASEADYGLDGKELNALKRGKFDLELLGVMPVSNRKALAKQFANSQAEIDRQYQLAKQGKSTDAPAPTDAPNASGSKEVANPADTAPGVTDKASANPAPDALFGAPWTMDDESYQTLVDNGGEDVARGIKASLEQAHAHVAQQNAQLAGVLSFVVDRLEQQDFSEAVNELAKKPGYENLTDEQRQEIRKQADLLIRTNGDITTYGFKQAVPIAAAGLFSTNVYQQAQANLAQRQNKALAGSAARADGKTTNTRPLTERDRMQSIFRHLQSGMSPAAAAAAVDGN